MGLWSAGIGRYGDTEPDQQYATYQGTGDRFAENPVADSDSSDGRNEREYTQFTGVVTAKQDGPEYEAKSGNNDALVRDSEGHIAIDVESFVGLENSTKDEEDRDAE